MTPEQRDLRRSILDSRPRTGLSGPFGPWLAVPSVCRPAQELGRTVRYGTSLTTRESELVILLTGAKFESDAEFDIHVGEARREGLGWDVIESMPRGERFAGRRHGVEFTLENVRERVVPALRREHDAMRGRLEGETDGDARASELRRISKARDREVAIVLFAAELLEANAVGDETYARTKGVLDGKDSVLVEITSIVGYYAYVAYTLNVFRIASSAPPPK